MENPADEDGRTAGAPTLADASKTNAPTDSQSAGIIDRRPLSIEELADIFEFADADLSPPAIMARVAGKVPDNVPNDGEAPALATSENADMADVQADASPIDEISAALTDGDSAESPSDRVEVDAGDDTTDGPITPRPMGFDVEDINHDHALVLWGGRAVIVKEQPAGPIEDRVRVLSIEAFDHWLSNRFTEVISADGKPKVLSWGRAWRASKRRRQYSGIEFWPNPDDAPGAPGYLNLWRGFGIEPAEEGSWAIFRDHLFNNVCRGDQALYEWVFGWFSHIVQRPRERVGTALVLRGAMGVGKSKVGEVIGSLFPAHYFQVDDQRYIVGNFNAHMASCLFLQSEEAIWAGDKHAEGRLKGLITSESQMIESKGVDPIRIKNFVRLMITSNEGWVVPAGLDERRFCAIDVHPRCAKNYDYFREMDEELEKGGRARLLYDLLRFDLGNLNLRDIPKTGALLEQKMRSLDPLDSWWLNRLMEGSPTRVSTGWQNLVTIDALYNDYLKAADEIGVGRKRDRSTFGLRLAILVPEVKRVRPRVEGDGRRPWCYQLPSLGDCRAAFDSLAGQSIEWLDCDLAGGEDAGPADDEVPL